MDVDERVAKAIAAAPWAITAEALYQICTIAARVNEVPEALATKAGERLDTTSAVTMRGDVAVLSVRGPIFRYANVFTRISGATSVEILARDFAAAVEDRRVNAILLEIDSPGGQVPGISEFADQVHAGARVKPVTAYISAQGQSAAYWIASAASAVIVQQTALVGSIGTLLAVNAPAKGGAIEFVSSQSPRKHPDPTSEAGRSEFQRLTDDLAQVFIESVATFRGLEASDVIERFGAGGSLVGAHAVAAGMADALGDFESILAGLSGDNKRGSVMGTKETANSPEITIELIANGHPAIAEHFRAFGYAEALDVSGASVKEALEEGHAAGVVDERARILAVESKSMPGHEALIASLKYDGETTGAQAAELVLEAEQKKRSQMRTDICADATAIDVIDPAASGGAEGATAADDLPFDEQVKAAWEKDADVRAEFSGSFERYAAFRKAEANGQARVLSHR